MYHYTITVLPWYYYIDDIITTIFLLLSYYCIDIILLQHYYYSTILHLMVGKQIKGKQLMTSYNAGK